MKTLYITDLDGTLLNSKGELSCNCQNKLNKLISDGLLFTVATARTNATVLNMFKNVSLNIPFVLMNGVLIYDPASKRYVSSHKIDKTTATKIIEIYKKYDNSPMLYFMKENYLEIAYNKIHNIYQENYINARDNLKQKVFKKITGELCIDESDSLIYIVSLDKPDVLSPIYNDIEKLDSIYCAYYSDNYTECNFMECMNKEASKGSAVLKIKELLSIDKIVAFGDNLNDLPLFEVADECYAVENACQELKDAATGIIGSNDNDGVINFIYNKFYNK